MSHYKQCLDYIKTTLDLDSNIGTTTKGLEFDVNKKNAFPLVHVLVIDSGVGDSDATVSFTFRLMAVKLRKVENTARSNVRWENNDNEDENLDEAHDILLRFHLNIRKTVSDFQITAFSPITPLIEERTNVVDGWQYEFTIEIPITGVC